jgi:hypothetical protein
VSQELTADEQAMAFLLTDLEGFCSNCLQVKPKVGRNVPFIWNRAQRYVHMRLQKQIEEQGYVRALILKGRQQGISTYVGARFYHQSSMNKSVGAFIVAHEDKSTTNLFEMVKRYHEWNALAPSIKASNAKELIFGQLDSGYKLATAGSQDVGRGNTAQLLHGSEFGFWANAQMHLAGIGNTIAEAEGTEMILESTANGLGNAFHLMWQKAEAGDGNYIAIFVPWFWQDEYRKQPKDDFTLSEEDRLYMLAYGLDMEQMAWRAGKISEYGEGFEWLFDQEYPATPALAFKSSTTNPLINPTQVAAAVNSGFREMRGPLIIGCDPAEEGFDRTSIVFRRGRTVFRVEYHEKKTTMQVAGLLAGYHKEFQPDAMFVDKIGIGSGIVDRLRELSIPVIGVNSGERAIKSDIYENRRAEMWWNMREWVMDLPCRLPNDAALISDLSAPMPDIHSSGRKLLESKKSMKKRQIRSPDGGDALALTFHSPVAERSEGDAAGGARGAATTAGY